MSVDAWFRPLGDTEWSVMNLLALGVVGSAADLVYSEGVGASEALRRAGVEWVSRFSRPDVPAEVPAALRRSLRTSRAGYLRALADRIAADCVPARVERLRQEELVP